MDNAKLRKQGSATPTDEKSSTLARTRVNPKVDPDANPGSGSGGPAGANSQEKRDFLTQDNEPLVAGSGNTLGDGRTAASSPGPAERGKLG